MISPRPWSDCPTCRLHWEGVDAADLRGYERGKADGAREESDQIADEVLSIGCDEWYEQNKNRDLGAGCGQWCGKVLAFIRNRAALAAKEGKGE